MIGPPMRLMDLWERTQNYIVVETIVDIAVTQHMPLWAAEKEWKDWWVGYRHQNG